MNCDCSNSATFSGQQITLTSWCRQACRPRGRSGVCVQFCTRQFRCLWPTRGLYIECCFRVKSAALGPKLGVVHIMYMHISSIFCSLVLQQCGWEVLPANCVALCCTCDTRPNCHITVLTGGACKQQCIQLS